MSRAVHFVGIGGMGMSGLAQLAHQLGYTVSGSDRNFQPNRSPYRELIASGIQITPQDGSGLLTEKVVDVVYSTAIEADNPDLIGAQERGSPLFHRAAFLQHLIPDEAEVIAIAGTAGKTTTTGLLGWIFEQAGLNPTVYCGGTLLNWKSSDKLGNTRAGNPQRWIIEVDESDRSLLLFHPTHTLLTNIGLDHFTIDELNHLFDQFKQQTHCLWIEPPESSCYPLPQHQLIGAHNETNMQHAFHFASRYGIPQTTISDALSSFKGMERRLQRIPSSRHLEVIDDYAHNPMKIQATLIAAQQNSRGHLHAFWRPHGFQPLETQFEALVSVYSTHVKEHPASLYLLPVYYAGGTVHRNVTSLDLYHRLIAQNLSVFYTPDYPALKELLLSHLKPNDTLLGMGARDPDISSFLEEWS